MEDNPASQLEEIQELRLYIDELKHKLNKAIDILKNLMPIYQISYNNAGDCIIMLPAKTPHVAEFSNLITKNIEEAKNLLKELDS